MNDFMIALLVVCDMVLLGAAAAVLNDIMKTSRVTPAKAAAIQLTMGVVLATIVLTAVMVTFIVIKG